MATTKETDTVERIKQQLICGLIMPISAIDGCSAEHWADVKSIVQEAVDAIEEPKFTTRLVSDADDIGVIQKRIVQGVYSSDVVICDVSAKNSNVMFELGMRLAFDKPTIIIKDDKTDYSFDTSIIEHLPYPRDLRFSKIVAFKELLASKVAATYLAATQNSNHSMFLKNFGTFKVAHLDQKEASSEQVILEMLSDVQREVSQLRRQITIRPRLDHRPVGVLNIVKALVKLRSENSKLDLELSDELMGRLLSLKDKDLEISRNYSTKESFLEAVAEACDIVKGII